MPATQERLDALERVAVEAVTRTYGPFGRNDGDLRFWVQKGIEAMRYAVAVENEED